MEINIKAMQFDLLENRFTLLAQGKGTLEGSTLIYRELADPAVRNEITFSDEGIILKRIADIRSTTVLKQGGRASASVRSPYGDMVLETELVGYRKDRGRWEAEYKIYSGPQLVTHQKFVWELSDIFD
ncbi:MAG: DUF1934 domain-containing protein [Solobacterium sp.]|nr:DUF1934 domain-containing protein [Solobacterium sp.]